MNSEVPSMMRVCLHEIDTPGKEGIRYPKAFTPKRLTVLSS